MTPSDKRLRPLLLVFPFDLLSHYLRCLELSRKLLPYFEIKFAYSPTYAHFIEREGFATFLCKNFDGKAVIECAEKFDFSWLNQKDLESVFDDQVRCIIQMNPFVVLGDTSPTLKMASEKTGVKYISLMNGYMTKYYAFTRKISRTHPAFKYSQRLPEKMFKFITKIAESIAFYFVHGPFKILRKRNKLSAYNYYLDELEGDLNLISELPELFPQTNLPDNYRIIPPLIYSSEIESSPLVTLLDKNKKTIFVSMGSTGDWEKVSFLNYDYFQKYNIVTAADRRNILNASHLIKREFINAEDILPHTDLVICHGGNGTIYQALSYGIPILCKTSHFEQEWNVFALERLGIGKSLDDMFDLESYKKVINDCIENKLFNQVHFFKEKIKTEENKLENIISDIIASISDHPLTSS